MNSIFSTKELIIIRNQNKICIIGELLFDFVLNSKSNKDLNKILSNSGDRRVLDRSRSRRHLTGQTSTTSVILTEEMNLDSMTADNIGASPVLDKSDNGPRRKVYGSMEEASGRGGARKTQTRPGPGGDSAEALLAELQSL